MIRTQQKAHFDTFGYLLMRQLFAKDEIREITQEADRLLEREREGRPFAKEGQSMAPFVEKCKLLTELVEDDRIYGTIESLIGPHFVWAGSEGNVTVRTEHRWHADRPGREELGYTRVKVMLYLDSTTRETGALRVIPGSHRMPLHTDLYPFNAHQADPDFQPFGVPGAETPSVALESDPGDVVFFNQSLFHAVYGGWAGRRYVALKFAATPETDEEEAALFRHASRHVHEAFQSSDSPRIQAMVQPLVQLGAGKVYD